MTTIPKAAVAVENAQITVDADVLASRLGLTVRALKENMAKGLVMSVSETGAGEDAGRTRLTFRYRARVWRVVIQPDGSLSEDPLPVGTATPVEDPSNLVDLARRGA